MEHLLDGQFVWLRSRTADVYLHADEDGLSLFTHANRVSRNAAWRVQHLLCQEGILVLLQGAGYGRYLATMEVPAPLGQRRFSPGQRDFNEPEALSIRWQADRSEDGDDILLINATPTGPFFLFTGIRGNPSPMRNWVVLPIPQIPGYLSVRLGPNLEGDDQWREILYVRASPDGIVHQNDWAAFPFAGRSVFILMNELAERLGLGERAFTMCVLAGPYARPTPLLVDLPISGERLHIVIFMAGTPAIQELRHPVVDAA